MSARNWEPVADKYPNRALYYYCLYNHYNNSATEWFISHAMALLRRFRSHPPIVLVLVVVVLGRFFAGWGERNSAIAFFFKLYHQGRLPLEDDDDDEDDRGDYR
jgi:hypothetical protein